MLVFFFADDDGNNTVVLEADEVCVIVLTGMSITIECGGDSSIRQNSSNNYWYTGATFTSRLTKLQGNVS